MKQLLLDDEQYKQQKIYQTRLRTAGARWSKTLLTTLETNPKSVAVQHSVVSIVSGSSKHRVSPIGYRSTYTLFLSRVQTFAFLNKASSNLQQWAIALLKWQPMSEEGVSGVREALNFVFTLRTKLKTFTLGIWRQKLQRQSSKMDILRFLHWRFHRNPKGKCITIPYATDITCESAVNSLTEADLCFIKTYR